LHFGAEIRAYIIKAYLENKRLVDVLLGGVGVEVWTLDKPEEELVDDLEMGPRELEDGLVLFRVEGVARRVDLRRYRSEEVGRELVWAGKTGRKSQLPSIFRKRQE
jgi:hypothetical protein